MRINLTTLLNVAKDPTNFEAVLCTNAMGIPSCLLFRTDLEALSAEVARQGIHPAIQKATSVVNFARILNDEIQNGDDMVVSAILNSKTFAKLAKRVLSVEVKFPVRHPLQLAVKW